MTIAAWQGHPSHQQADTTRGISYTHPKGEEKASSLDVSALKIRTVCSAKTKPEGGQGSSGCPLLEKNRLHPPQSSSFEEQVASRIVSPQKCQRDAPRLPMKCPVRYRLCRFVSKKRVGFLRPWVERRVSEARTPLPDRPL